MKKISIAFAASMALLTFAGCKKKGPDIGAMAKEVCACKDMACAQDVQKKWADKMGADKGAGDVKEPSEEDKKAIKDMTDCMTKLAMAGAGGDMKADDKKADEGKKMDEGAKKDEAAGGGDKMAAGEATGIKECDDLMAAYAKYFECDKFKAAGEAVTKAAHDGFDAMKKGWANLKDAPQAAKDAAVTGCKQGMDAVNQAAKAMGCSL
jgi:hypothetical protein